MSKVNPANKQVEELSGEDSSSKVDEMLEKYEEVKEGQVRTGSIDDVRESLPSQAWFEDGEIIQNSSRNPDQKESLTNARRQILRAYAEYPELNSEELGDVVGFSQSYVHKTLTDWSFLFHPELFESVILQGLHPEDRWKVKVDDELYLSTEEAFAREQAALVEDGRDVAIVSPSEDSDSLSPEAFVQSGDEQEEEPAHLSSEDVDRLEAAVASLEEMLNHTQDNHTQDNQADGEYVVSFTEDEFYDVVGGMFRLNKDDVAKKMIENHG